ncbi:uncharacterized protein Z518_03159 [Rhinocladiella mackenziei CBS 650.93]|uniref:Rhinocladiella mackenziei CBS 650.93 unplaced genomic scaffold supercont1.2, whole genome shotgun sequence n=1 Tax=Rhinocladiella mackenziei CBS 650.93 TaxID=1442369 RepID=A0A0D2HDE7_9EURO|nr:uncharacterized protein Z518_03159 [Rhinocladiella mackenziei CBS 650.93]KIX08503.1 hypothetical protein Z518_03159 [Rhinocladiella mackenziei CBS 650.93]
MPNPAKRMTANPAKPVARYRPGKPVAEQESSDEEEESVEEQQQTQQRKPQPARPQPIRPQAAVEEESEDDDEEGFVTELEDGDGDEDASPKSPQQPIKHSSTASIPPPIKRGETSAESEEEDESTEEEEESSSEDEEPQRKFQRPTFIKKSDRKQSSANTSADSVNGAPMSSSADPESDRQSRRLAQTDLMIKDKLERDALARAQGKKAWDDDDEILPESMVDDTDGLDPEAEYAAWKVRELKRLKRDREALIAREKELEEIERRRNLTAEEREKEDKEFIDKQRRDHEDNRTEAQFLARYHHSGAFFQGDETADHLKRRNIMGARFEDDVLDKSTLPEYMQLRDMTKLGKKGRTRHRDLKGEDTGRFGEDVKRWRGSGGAGGFGNGQDGAASNFDTRGLDERFLPDDQRGGGASGPTGANASAVAPRQDRNRDRVRDRERDSYRDSEYERNRDRDRDRRKRFYSRSRTRSRSPRRRKTDWESRDEYHARDRDRDREGERHHGVKSY